MPGENRDEAAVVTNSSTSATDDSVQTPADSAKSSPAKPEVARLDVAKETTKKKHVHAKSKASKAKAKAKAVAKSSDADDDSDSDSDSDSDDSDADAPVKKGVKPRKSSKRAAKDKKAAKKQLTKSKKKGKGKKKSKAVDSDSDSSDDDTSDSSESEAEEEAETDQPDADDEVQALKTQILQLQGQLQHNSSPGYGPGTSFSYPANGTGTVNIGFPPAPFYPGNQALSPPGNPPVHPPRGVPGNQPGLHVRSTRRHSNPPEDRASVEEDKPASKNNKKLEFKRVDWVWDDSNHRWKLQDSSNNENDSRYDGYVFHVRRSFDWEGRYRSTSVDIKSKLLRECLKDVIGEVTGVSLVEEKPKLEPNFLFLYLEDLREHRKALKEMLPAGDSRKERKKNQKRLDEKRAHLKVLLKYLDHDYANVKKSLYPMLESGIISYEYVWALWKPNTMGYMSTYGTPSEPRVFKVEMAISSSSILKGNFYIVDGKYFEYDGKKFGYGSVEAEIPEFSGARKITSLPCYPLKYHRDEAKLRTELIARGKKFVSLAGVHYKSFQGIAFMKRKKNQIMRFHVQQSRVMVDSTNFRRINPNYYVSNVRPKDHDLMFDSDASDSEGACCDCSDSDSSSSEGKKRKYVTKAYKNKDGDIEFVVVPKDELEDLAEEALTALPERKKADGEANGEESDDLEELTFTDEEFLIASPVVLGFSFSEKVWLEFPVSKIDNISWSDKAWDSLVLDPGTKDLIKALVESRKFQASKTIDDVIQGKGKGLVTVLHGPPGTGKTLTAEGISELLKCPLYMVSAGELGTDSRYLEAELQKILDICHAWGAILLLDEADVFLEKRDMHNIHRNALVSIFLRQLEYFQGILFLTTNRVETFDEAFQSRIHIALRYDQLDAKAKRTIFEMFLNKVKALGKLEVQPLTEDDLQMLSKQDLNGREIKNVVGSAQDLAVHKSEALSMRHIKHVLNVYTKFGRDLKGGSGYEDAMRSYF